MTCEELLNIRIKKAFENGFFQEITQPEKVLSFVTHQAHCAAGLKADETCCDCSPDLSIMLRGDSFLIDQEGNVSKEPLN